MPVWKPGRLLKRRSFSQRPGYRFKSGRIYTRREALAIRKELADGGYKTAIIDNDRGSTVVIIGPKPLWNSESQWCWTGSYIEFTQRLVLNESHDNLKPVYLDWLRGDLNPQLRAVVRNVDLSPHIRVSRHRRHRGVFRVVFPQGCWKGNIKVLAHAVATAYPHRWNLRATLARMKGWRWDDEFPNDKELMDAVMRRHPPAIDDRWLDKAVKKLKSPVVDKPKSRRRRKDGFE